MQASDDLNPVRVHALFSAVPDEECELLDLAGRPEDLIISHVQVPPVCIRPSVEVDGGGGSNEDDITVKLGVRLLLKKCAVEAATLNDFVCVLTSWLCPAEFKLSQSH